MLLLVFSLLASERLDSFRDIPLKFLVRKRRVARFPPDSAGKLRATSAVRKIPPVFHAVIDRAEAAVRMEHFSAACVAAAALFSEKGAYGAVGSADAYVVLRFICLFCFAHSFSISPARERVLDKCDNSVFFFRSSCMLYAMRASSTVIPWNALNSRSRWDWSK